jgi:hypothetical protein
MKCWYNHQYYVAMTLLHPINLQKKEHPIIIKIVNECIHTLIIFDNVAHLGCYLILAWCAGNCWFDVAHMTCNVGPVGPVAQYNNRGLTWKWHLRKQSIRSTGPQKTWMNRTHEPSYCVNRPASDSYLRDVTTKFAWRANGSKRWDHTLKIE